MYEGGANKALALGTKFKRMPRNSAIIKNKFKELNSPESWDRGNIIQHNKGHN